MPSFDPLNLAAALRRGMAARPHIIRRLREASGTVLCALGLPLAFAWTTP
jgi:hypothetical protein